jgi:hypothetical protein
MMGINTVPGGLFSEDHLSCRYWQVFEIYVCGVSRRFSKSVWKNVGSSGGVRTAVGLGVGVSVGVGVYVALGEVVAVSVGKATGEAAPVQPARKKNIKERRIIDPMAFRLLSLVDLVDFI